MFSRNQVFCLKNLKLWRVSTTTELNILCWNFACVFYLPCLQKDLGIFFILFRSFVICKNQKDLVSTHSFFTFLLITADLNKIKKISSTFLLTFLSRTLVENFSKIISLLVGIRQRFKFFRQTSWFLGNSRTLSKFRYRILHYLINIIKFLKKLVCKSQFYINHASHF